MNIKMKNKTEKGITLLGLLVSLIMLIIVGSLATVGIIFAVAKGLDNNRKEYNVTCSRPAQGIERQETIKGLPVGNRIYVEGIEFDRTNECTIERISK